MLGREFEEMCAQMYYRGKMFGFVHLYSGQEAVSTGEQHPAVISTRLAAPPAPPPAPLPLLAATRLQRRACPAARLQRPARASDVRPMLATAACLLPHASIWRSRTAAARPPRARSTVAVVLPYSLGVSPRRLVWQ